MLVNPKHKSENLYIISEGKIALAVQNEKGDD